MKFFTDKTVVNDYLLIKIKDYLKLKDFSRWKEIFIDPGVYDLVNSDKFKWEHDIDILKFLDLLPENHYFSFDYPGDMNLQYQDLFLEKTWINAIKYHSHSQYIVTAQYKFRNYMNFMNWFKAYNALDIKSGILGLGNLCRFRSLNQYLKHALSYAFFRCNHSRIHIYGLCLKAIPYAYNLAKKTNIELSIDSTKWTRAVNKKCRDFSISCRNVEERQLFFNEYLKVLRNRGIILENELF